MTFQGVDALQPLGMVSQCVVHLVVMTRIAPDVDF